MAKLNLGCGFDIKPGYVNVDGVPGEGVDKVFDFEEVPYPFKDNTFDEVYCSMVMEHIHNLPQMIDEIVRICKDGALLKIIVPYQSSPSLWGDITHLRGFNLNSFASFHKNSLILKNGEISVKKQKIFFLSHKDFLQSSHMSYILDFLINLFPRFYERFFLYILPSSSIHYLIMIKK